MAEDSRKLFVAGLPDTVSEEVLKQLFEATGGNVVEVSLPKDRATGRPRGFGFVTLASTEEASAAREALDGSFQGGKSISVRPFQAEPPKRDGGGPPGSGRPGGPGGGPGAAAPDRTLYVGNLPYDTSVEEVEAMITGTGAGPVVRVHLPADPDGRKRGFGFVTMASAESAKSAIELLRGVDVRGRRLVVNLAHPKGERPAREGGFAGPGGGGYGGGGYSGGGGGGGYPAAGGPPSGGRDFGGAPNKFAGAPPPQRKTFDDRRRRTHDDGGGAGAGGGRNKRGKDDWDGGRGKDDWDD
jgi:nucleolin